MRLKREAKTRLFPRNEADEAVNCREAESGVGIKLGTSQSLIVS